MSDSEAAPVAAAAPAVGGQRDVLTNLQTVLRTALIHDGIARGLHECAKALDRRQALLCVLASNCDEPNYVRLVEALCSEHKIHLVKVPDNKQLGEWVGLCKIDADGLARNVVACSCVVVKDYGEESDSLTQLLEHFNESKA